MDVAAAALASDAPSEEPAVVVKVVDTAAARPAVVRPCLAHAHVAVRRQAGALELARAAPPYAAAHAVRAQLLVLQVLEPLERLAWFGFGFGFGLGLGIGFGFGFGFGFGLGFGLGLGLGFGLGLGLG